MDDLPIVLDENGNILIFNSRKHAEGYLEAIDVANGEYVGYDGAGRLLTLDVVPRPSGSGRGESVSIDLAEHDPAHAADLRHKLVAALRDTDLWSDALEKAPLDELVTTATQRFKVL